MQETDWVIFYRCVFEVSGEERSRIEWHQYYIEVVTLSVGHTRNSVPLAIRNPPHVTASKWAEIRKNMQSREAARFSSKQAKIKFF